MVRRPLLWKLRKGSHSWNALLFHSTSFRHGVWYLVQTEPCLSGFGVPLASSEKCFEGMICAKHSGPWNCCPCVSFEPIPPCGLRARRIQIRSHLLFHLAFHLPSAIFHLKHGCPVGHAFMDTADKNHSVDPGIWLFLQQKQLKNVRYVFIFLSPKLINSRTAMQPSLEPASLLHFLLSSTFPPLIFSSKLCNVD